MGVRQLLSQQSSKTNVFILSLRSHHFQIHHATTRRGEAWLGPVLGSLLAIASTITVVSWILVAALYLATGGVFFARVPVALIAIAFCSLPLMVWDQYHSALLLALDKVTLYNRAQIVGRTVGVALILVAWRTNLGIPGVLFAALIAQAVVSGIGTNFLFASAAQTVRVERSLIKRLILGGVQLHFNYIGDFFLASASILIVDHFVGAAQTGHYQVALQLMSVATIVPQAASLVMYGNVAQLGPDAAWASHRRVVITLLVAVTATAILGAILAPYVIPLLLGERFRPSIRLFQVLLLAAPGIALAKSMTAQWIGRGLFAFMSWVTVGFGALNLVSNLFLVPRFGAIGAAWSLVGVYVPIGLLQLYMIKRWESAAESPQLQQAFIANQ
jgi:O-antigen/teichoic acid export membrane protein